MSNFIEYLKLITGIGKSKLIVNDDDVTLSEPARKLANYLDNLINDEHSYAHIITSKNGIDNYKISINKPSIPNLTIIFFTPSTGVGLINVNSSDVKIDVFNVHFNIEERKVLLVKLKTLFEIVTEYNLNVMTYNQKKTFLNLLEKHEKPYTKKVD